MKLELRLHTDRFVVSEAIFVEVIFTNLGTEPRLVPNPGHEVNWQPTFTLQGPAYPKGLTFSARQAVLGDPTQNPAGVSPVLLEVPPGQSVQEQIPLSRWFELTAPGHYRLTADYREGSELVSARPVSFDLDKLTVVAASLGADLGHTSQQDTPADWLHQAPAGRRLYTLAYTEPRTDIEMAAATFALTRSSPNISFLSGVPQAAERVYVPWASYRRSESFHGWHVWSERSRLCALPLLSSLPGCFDLKGGFERVVRPTLLSPSGELDVFLLNFRSSELGLVRFPAAEEGKAPAPRLLWKQAVKGKVMAARASFAPGGGRRVVVIAQDGESLAVHLVDAGDGSAVPVVHSFAVADGIAVAGSEPGLTTGADGETRVAALFERMDRRAASGSRRRSIAIFDARLDAGGKLVGSAAVEDLGLTDALLAGAAVAYPVLEGRPPRRDWMLQTEKKRVYGSSFGRPMVEPSGGAPLLPFEMIALGSVTYYLTKGGDTGPQLVPLR